MNQKDNNPVTEVIGAVDGVAQDVVETADKVVGPYRRSAFRRFPVLFTLLVAFGAAATILGFERIIIQYEWLSDRPFIILIVGISILVLTGKLYKKLG